MSLIDFRSFNYLSAATNDNIDGLLSFSTIDLGSFSNLSEAVNERSDFLVSFPTTDALVS